jgi:hypothetical protein
MWSESLLAVEPDQRAPLPVGGKCDASACARLVVRARRRCDIQSIIPAGNVRKFESPLPTGRESAEELMFRDFTGIDREVRELEVDLHRGVGDTSYTVVSAGLAKRSP